MPEITTADACARYLQLLGGSARLIAAPFGLRPDAEAGLASFVDAASGFLASAQAQLGQIGLAHRFHFGLIDNATTAEQLGGASQDAYAATDPFARRGETRASFVLFTLPFARDILLAWEALLSRRELFRDVGDPDKEAPVGALVTGGPADPARARYAIDQAMLTLEFALLHEFYHVACGHLDAIRSDRAAACLHAVTASQEQRVTSTRLYKVLELDADAMALRHLTMGVLRGETLVAHDALTRANDVERFRQVGRSLTLLFRLIELWRRNANLEYLSKDFHPHPDVRDAALHAYLRVNADPEDLRSGELAQGYEQGQDDIIEALEAMNTLAPSFGIVEGMGQDLAIRETEWLIPELNRVRKGGVGPQDFRRLAAQRRRP